MRRWLAVLVLAMSGTSCMLLGPDGQELHGIPVEQAAGVMHGIGDDINLWDVNKDGVLNGNEYYAVGLAAGMRLLTAMQAAQAEADAVEAARAAAEAVDMEETTPESSDDR